MSKDCGQLPRAVWLDHDCPREEFERRLGARAAADDGWVTIAACVDCGQWWRVDTADKYSVDLAIKVTDAQAWTADDDRSVRIEYLTQSYGGEDAHRCVWAGCSNPRLKGVAMCAEHLYDRMGVRAKGA